jgi:hypothetical protein
MLKSIGVILLALLAGFLGGVIGRALPHGTIKTTRILTGGSRTAPTERLRARVCLPKCCDILLELWE